MPRLTAENYWFIMFGGLGICVLCYTPFFILATMAEKRWKGQWFGNVMLMGLFFCMFITPVFMQAFLTPVDSEDRPIKLEYVTKAIDANAQ